MQGILGNPDATKPVAKARTEKCFVREMVPRERAMFSYLMAQSDIVVALCLQIHNLTS